MTGSRELARTNAYAAVGRGDVAARASRREALPDRGGNRLERDDPGQRREAAEQSRVRKRPPEVLARELGRGHGQQPLGRSRCANSSSPSSATRAGRVDQHVAVGADAGEEIDLVEQRRVLDDQRVRLDDRLARRGSRRSSIRQNATTGAPVRSDPNVGNACAYRPSSKAATESSSAAVTTPCPPRPWMRIWNMHPIVARRRRAPASRSTLLRLRTFPPRSAAAVSESVVVRCRHRDGSDADRVSAQHDLGNDECLDPTRPFSSPSRRGATILAMVQGADDRHPRRQGPGAPTSTRCLRARWRERRRRWASEGGDALRPAVSPLRPCRSIHRSRCRLCDDGDGGRRRHAVRRLTHLLGGVAFSLGLVLVVIAGAELFTGNNLIVMAWASRRVTTAAFSATSPSSMRGILSARSALPLSCCSRSSTLPHQRSFGVGGPGFGRGNSAIIPRAYGPH